MAVYDRDSAKIIVRVVYDGPGNAGKTTNLVELCQFFTSRRRSELISPEVRDGRTLWFDWVQIDAGVIAGYGLRCQIVTVPGQLVLRRRRSALLRAADVVVLVCDSSPSGVELVRPAFGRIRQFVADHAGSDVPIVLQANKQDLPGAISPEELAASLGADSSIPSVGARANAGVGVKETLVLAIRAAADRAQQLVLEVGVDALAGPPDDADSVLRELKRLDDTFDEGLDLLLTHKTFIEVGSVGGAPRVPLIPPPPLPILGEPAAELPIAWPAPPLAHAEVAPGSLWPAATGREGLHRLAYGADGWCLKTSTSRRFDDDDAARMALIELARTKTTLGALPIEGTVLAIGGDAATGYWVWTFAPWRTSLRGAMTGAIAAGDPEALGAVLVQLVGAVTEAFERALRAGQGLDLHPSNFAMDGERLVYLDDEPPPAPPVPNAAHAILQRAGELPAYPAVVEHDAATAPPSLTAAALEPATPAGKPGRLSWPLPPTSADGLPSGFIWPAAGRELIRQLASRSPIRRAGVSFTYELGDYTLSTSVERRYLDVDDGRAELLRLARAHVARGTFEVDTVLVLAPDDAHGGHWIWTIAASASGACASP